MGKDKKEGRVEEGWVLFEKFYLSFEIIPGIIKGMDFIHPEGLFIKGIEPEGKADKKAEEKDQDFYLF